MRGKQMQCSSKPGENGITPADAGKTSPTESTRRNAWDHPRGCGENVSVGTFVNLGMGSPPRMRGKP